MQPFHTINGMYVYINGMCGEVVLSQGLILVDQSATFHESTTDGRTDKLWDVPTYRDAMSNLKTRT